MKKISIFVILLISVSIITLSVKGQTPISGNIDGPLPDLFLPVDYIAVGDITVTTGNSLIIGQNVTIMFSSSTSLTVPNTSQLIAIAGNIIFSSYTDWSGIYVNGYEGAAKFNHCEIHNVLDHSAITFNNAQDNSLYRIEYCLISSNDNSGTNTSRESAGIQCYNSSPDIIGNEICNNTNNNYTSALQLFNSGTAISCHNNSNPNIESNNIHDNHNNTPLIDNSIIPLVIIDHNYGSGSIGCYVSSDAYIYNNLIIHNDATGQSASGGIQCYESSPDINSNTIQENSGWAGGIDIGNSSSPHVYNNLIFANHATQRGGGILIHRYSSPIIDGNNIIANNIADYTGGGINITISTNCSPEIWNNLIIGNLVNYLDMSGTEISGGGGIAINKGNMNPTSASITIHDNVIRNNRAIIDPYSGNSINAGMGGGIYNEKIPNVSVSIYNDSILCNFAQNNGGGIHTYSFNGKLTGNTFTQNNCYGNGGGIYLANPTMPGGPFKFAIESNSIITNWATLGGNIFVDMTNQVKILNNLIVQGQADNGAGIYLTGGATNPIVISNTIVNNQETQYAYPPPADPGYGIYCGQVNPSGSYYNNILYNNNDNNNNPYNANYNLSMGNTYPIFDYCDIELYSGTNPNNIASDPDFSTNPNYPYQPMRASSPCIDAGNDGYSSMLTVDLLGRNRFVQILYGPNYIDMGCYEHDISYTPKLVEGLDSNTLMSKENSDCSIKVYPNPVTSIAVIQLSLEKDSYVKIDVMNNIGQYVGTICNAFLTKDNYTYKWITDQQPKGIYNLRVINGNDVKMFKLLVE